MNNAITALIKTYVPIIVGAVIAWLLTINIKVDAETQAAIIVALTGLLQAVYVTLVKLLSAKWPGLEVLLGSAKQPSYYTTEAISAEPTDQVNVLNSDQAEDPTGAGDLDTAQSGFVSSDAAPEPRG